MTTSSPRPEEFAGKRIVVVNWRDLDHSLAGGAEIYAWQCARALREGGAEVVFLTAREAGQTAHEVRDQIAVRRGGGPLGFYLFALAWLLGNRRRIDAVIDPACGLPSFSPLVLRRGTPALLIIHHVHQAQFGVHFPAPVAAFGRWLERVAMRWVYRRHAVAAVSPSTSTEMRSQLGWTGEVQILANGADLPSYDAAEAVLKDPHRVVVLGRLVTHKRVDLALDAVARLGDDRVRVDVIGQGPERERLEQHAARLGIGDRVTFHGYVAAKEKDALLARSSVHLCASDAEGWGQAVIDAAACGVPTIARDVPGLRDSIRDGDSGWLVTDATDADTIVARIGDRLEQALVEAADPSARRHRAEACLTWARTFDWTQMRSSTRRLVAAILTGSAPAAPGTTHPRVDRVAA